MHVTFVHVMNILKITKNIIIICYLRSGDSSFALPAFISLVREGY